MSIETAVAAMKTQINKLPHWLIVAALASFGATDGYLRQQGAPAIEAAVQHWSTLWPILRETGVVGVMAFFAMLRREPWLEILGGGNSTGGGLVQQVTTTQTVAISPPAPAADKFRAYGATRVTLFVLLAVAACGGQTAQTEVTGTYGAVVFECTQLGLSRQQDGWTCFGRVQTLYCDADAGIANILTDGGFCKDGAP